MRKANMMDKIRFLRFQSFTYDYLSGMVCAYVVYDVSKLRRIEYFEICRLVFEKTLKIYPFAVVENAVGWADADCKTAQIMVRIPLSPIIGTSEVLKGGGAE